MDADLQDAEELRALLLWLLGKVAVIPCLEKDIWMDMRRNQEDQTDGGRCGPRTQTNRQHGNLFPTKT